MKHHSQACFETDGSLVRIGDAAIGAGRPAYLIAEAGVNHNGSIERALSLVDAAAEAGADAVKFQIFSAAQLATMDAGTAKYQRSSGASQREMLRRLELSDEEFARLRARCAEREIAFLATPFSEFDLERLERLDPPALKLASTDLDNLPLLRACVATGRPLIFSTGAATPEEIMGALERLRSLGALERTIPLHCVSAYPAPLHRLNLRAIAALSQASGRPCGLSDHSTDARVGGWAVAAGASVLEKHFTLDRSLPGPDHAMSLTPNDLACYIANVREVEAALGNGALGMCAIENDVRMVARKSVVAAERIPAGVTLTRAMLAVKRPAGGIEPPCFDELPGRISRVEIAADTPLTWDMLR